MDMVKTLGAFVDLLKANPLLPLDFYSVDLTAQLPQEGVSAHLRAADDEKESALLEWALFLGSNVEYGGPSRGLDSRWTRRLTVAGEKDGLRMRIYAYVPCEVTVKQAQFVA